MIEEIVSARSTEEFWLLFAQQKAAAHSSQSGEL